MNARIPTTIQELINRYRLDKIASKTSELENDSNFISDGSYVHTDNNYTNDERDKLAGLTQVTKTSELTNDSGFITSSSDITGNAATATRATQDSSGKNIVDTYATKTELSELSDKIIEWTTVEEW